MFCLSVFLLCFSLSLFLSNFDSCFCLSVRLQGSSSQEEPKKRAVARKSTAQGSAKSSSEESGGPWQAPWVKQQRRNPVKGESNRAKGIYFTEIYCDVLNRGTVL